MPMPRAARKAIVRQGLADGACMCQTIRIVSTVTGWRYDFSRVKDRPAHCKHWYIVDNETGDVTNERLYPINRKTVASPGANSMKRRKAWKSPFNRK